jgi:hypothetical protein
LSLAELVLALPPALSPIELDLLLVVVLRLLCYPEGYKIKISGVQLICPKTKLLVITTIKLYMTNRIVHFIFPIIAFSLLLVYYPCYLCFFDFLNLFSYKIEILIKMRNP